MFNKELQEIVLKENADFLSNVMKELKKLKKNKC